MNTVGSGEYRYRIIEDWAKLPEGWQFGILVGVAVTRGTGCTCVTSGRSRR